MQDVTVNKRGGKSEMLLLMEEGKKNGNKHISFSEFDLFNKCGHKHLVFKYLALDSEPPSIHLAFGDAVHATIESALIDTMGSERRMDYFRARFKKNMDNTMRGQPEYAQMDDFMEQGCNILTKIDINSLLSEYEVISIEEPLYEPVHGNFYFKGFIDLVLRHKTNGRYLILDWKTSTAPWNLKYKFEDTIFLMQMKMYKYFWARKNNVDLSKIDVKYMVLNRLADKRNPKKGFGDIQEVAMTSTQGEIREAMTLMAKTIRSIHIDKRFRKAKFVLDKNGDQLLNENQAPKVDEKACMFCKYKGGKHPLCNSNFHQDKTLLHEHGVR